MKKLFVLCVLSFSFGLLPISFLANANQTNLSNYYASPSGNYTKIRLVNNGSITTSSFCSGGANAGAIFADSATGYLEICKADGSLASYPGSCFNRFGSGPCLVPTSSNACPNNYQAVSCQPFSIAGSSASTWSCCFTGQNGLAVGTAIPGGTVSTSKSGCFSIYSNTTSGLPTYSPALCSSVDSDSYDVGCETIFSSDIVTPVYKRNCCFNDSSVSRSFASTCVACGTCNPQYACGSNLGTCSISGNPCSTTPGSCGAGCCTASDTCSTNQGCGCGNPAPVCGTCGGSLNAAGCCGSDAKDCNGTCGGSATVVCGVCGGSLNAAGCCGSQTKDCAGTCGGSATVVCGVCGGSLNAAGCCGSDAKDCNGTCGGSATMVCGVCGGSLSCDGTCDGATISCGVCGGCTGDTTCVDGSCQSSCSGTVGCDGVCNSGKVVDCAGTCGGIAAKDQCGVCGGACTSPTDSSCTTPGSESGCVPAPPSCSTDATCAYGSCCISGSCLSGHLVSGCCPDASPDCTGTCGGTCPSGGCFCPGVCGTPCCGDCSGETGCSVLGFCERDGADVGGSCSPGVGGC